MELKKPSTLVNGGRDTRFPSDKSADTGDSSTIDHWAFLEEIDAPMWVDLTVESMSADQDINATWFQQLHPFHQLSSHHLLGEGNGISESVSKSRGKHFRSRKWRGDSHLLSLGKKHPIKSFGAKNSLLVSSSGREIKPVNVRKFAQSLKGRVPSEGSKSDTRRMNLIQGRPSVRSSKNRLIGDSSSSDGMNPKYGSVRSCFGVSEETLALSDNVGSNSNSASTSGSDPLKFKLSLVDSGTSLTNTSNAPQSKSGDLECTSKTAENFIGSSSSARHNISNSPKTKPSLGGLKISLNSKESTGSESNLHKSGGVPDLSHQIFGPKIGLLSAVRISLRRSYVTRQPSRVKVKEKIQPKGRKSSTSKSSVGSSNSGCNLKNSMFAATMNITPESRQAKEVDQHINHNKTEIENLAKTHDGQLPDCSFSSKLKGKTTGGRFVSKETSKMKSSYQSERRRPLQPQNVKNSYAEGPKAKDHVTNTNKRSAIGQNAPSQKTAIKESDVQSTLWNRNASKQFFVRKDKKVIDTKQQEKANASDKLTNPKNLVPRVYFR